VAREVKLRNILVILAYLLIIIGTIVLRIQKYITTGEVMSFIGVILLGTIALFQEQFRRWWSAPRLRIDFKLEAPYCSKTPFYAFFEEETLSTEAYYFRIKVINTGKSSAKLCEVIMTELLVRDGDSFHEVKYFQKVNLKWDTGKTKDAYITINPSPVGLLCDIGYISKDYESTLFHLEYLYTIGGHQPKVLAPKAKYRFTIGVISENAEFISKSFEFYWNGLWKDAEEEMFKEIIIRPV